ncbi:MAG: cytochrome c [Chitinophagales bacterium]|nr:cytochrome c [Chitinophagales bacterium]
MDSQTKKFYLKIGVALLFVAFLLYKSPKSPGSIYAPDMAFSKAYETYSDDNPRGTMLPVANTVSRNALPSDELYQKEKSVIYSYNYTRFYQNTDADKARAGAELNNPYEPTEAVLARAKVVYDKQCAICHGEKGLGDGKLIVREDGSDGAYKSVPPKYSDRLVGMKDGEIFHSITYGKNLMGAHAAHVKADDRWKLVCYIKELGGLNKASDPAAAAPADSTKK